MEQQQPLDSLQQPSWRRTLHPPLLAYIDGNGEASKPFLLPQKDAGFYHRFMKSYNIPEFIIGPVEVSARRLALTARDTEGTDLTFLMR
jgi:hypothetical protein